MLKKTENNKYKAPQDYIKCVAFHGHSCPGLVYGYMVAKEASKLLDIKRASDEEIVAICENDSCAVDALQVILGTSTGKGNLIVKNYGKNVYTIIKRATNKAYRFSRKKDYKYTGAHKNEFETLEKSVASGKADTKERKRQKHLKVEDLLNKEFSEIFDTKELEPTKPPYAPLSPSVPCSICGEMTMKSKMIPEDNGNLLCIPCSKTKL